MIDDLKPTLSFVDMDRQRLMHPMTSIVDHMQKGPLIITKGKGVWLTDIDGKEYIDCCAGLWCMNIGYGRTEIAEAARIAIEQFGYYHLFGHASNEAIIRLADRVLHLLQEQTNSTHFSKVFFGCSGSDANDTNFKIVHYYNNLRGRPNKKKFISRIGAYHGLSYASASLTGIEAYHKAFDLPIDSVLHTSCPHYYRFHKETETEVQFCDRMIRDLTDLIACEGADNIAAFIAEPIMGTGGVLLPPQDYFKRVQEILKKNEILFIVDEVITAFGRTGHWFASGHYNLKPDIITLAKGITSAYFPVSASVLSEEIWDVLFMASPEMGPVMHGYTYSGHPVGGAIGLVNLDIIERESLIDNSREVGAYFLQRLKDSISDHPYVGDVRGQGLMMAVELIADRKTRRPFNPEAGVQRLIVGKCIEQGIFTRVLPFIEVIPFSPPLCMTREEADEAIERYTRAMNEAIPELKILAK